MTTDDPKGLALFEQQMIRRVWHNNEWYYSIIDVIAVLTESAVTPQYRLELDLTVPGTWVFTGRYERIHPATHAPGIGSMPQARVWRKRTHRRPFAYQTPVHLPCL